VRAARFGALWRTSGRLALATSGRAQGFGLSTMRVSGASA